MGGEISSGGRSRNAPKTQVTWDGLPPVPSSSGDRDRRVGDAQYVDSEEIVSSSFIQTPGLLGPERRESEHRGAYPGPGCAWRSLWEEG